jgi:AraC-like DNA-binding protein
VAVAKFTLDPQTNVLLADLGLNHANVLRRAGLPGDLFARQSVTVSSHEYIRLWEAVQAETGDPALPLRIAAVLTVEAFSPSLFAALCSADLEQAARRLQTYKSLIGPIRLDVEVDEQAATIACHWLDQQPPAALALTELLFWVALARIGTRHDVHPIAVVTTEPPFDQAPYLEALDVPIESGTRHAITFTVADATRPFLTASEAMWTHFEPLLRKRLADIDADATTEDRVRAALIELLPAGRSSVRDVGRSLAMSPRTLQRRLGDEGSSFQTVLTSTRMALARHYLTNETISTVEISFLLGYADSSSFYRAFRDWTGLTPEQMRAGAA